MVFTGQQRVDSLPRDLIRLAFGLTLLPHLRIVHSCTMEEIRIGRAGLKSGYANAGFFQLISKATRV